MANHKNAQGFENYQPKDSLGRGRFAEVFLALKRDIGREVALKVLLPEWNDNPQVREQFMIQARLIARLRHFNIVEVLDLGEENGRLYMALEYLPGGDLSRWLAEQRPNLPSLLKVASLIEDAAGALDFIHSQQLNGQPLVHGDVKPGNLLLFQEASGRLRLKLCDLGLLTVLQQAATLSGSAVFPQSSPLYISPEQASEQPPLPASDQYSLALVAYELLTGRPPFNGGSSVTLYLQHRQEAPQPPSALQPGLPPEIDSILLRALAKDPAARFPTCAEFARALRQAVESAEQKRFASLLQDARAALGQGQPEEALPALEEARQMKPANPEAKALLEQAQQSALAARSYREAAALLEEARAEAQALRAEARGYPDPQKLLATFAPLPPSLWQKAWRRWKTTLLLTAALLLLAALGSLTYAAATTTRATTFQTRLAPFWTASPTFTPTFTPTPPLLQPARATQVTLLHNLGGLETAGWVYSVAFSPDGARLASGSADRTIILWDVKTGQQLATLSGHGDYVRSVAFSPPNGARLASGSADRTIILWDAKSGQQLATLRGHGSWVSSVAFSPDGARLASGSADKTIILWDVKSGQQLATLRGHGSWVSSVAFSPDGALLASGSADGTIILWDVKTGQQLATLRGHSGDVLSVAFSPDGWWLASASKNEVFLWGLPRWDSLTPTLTPTP